MGIHSFPHIAPLEILAFGIDPRHLAQLLQVLIILLPGQGRNLAPVPGKDYEEISRHGVSLLRDLHDLQNGPGLERDRPEWEKTMKEIYEFLNQHETDKP